MFNNLKVLVFVIAITISCGKKSYNPHLVEYLKAERNLRKNVSEQEGLSDSIAALQKRYKINLEKEFSKLRDEPDGWLKLLKELGIEK